MKAVSTVRSRTAGVSRRGLGAAVLLCAGVLPILSMGITVPSAVAVREQRDSRVAGMARLDERNDAVRRLGKYCEEDVLEQVRQIGATLYAMIPTGVRPLDEFGSIREASDARGIVLREIRLSRTHATPITGEVSGSGSLSYAIVVDEVAVSLHESPAESLALVDDLRAGGHPIVVLGFDMARTNVAQESFQTELRLGFLRRVVRATAPGTTDMQTP